MRIFFKAQVLEFIQTNFGTPLLRKMTLKEDRIIVFKRSFVYNIIIINFPDCSALKSFQSYSRICIGRKFCNELFDFEMTSRL